MITLRTVRPKEGACHNSNLRGSCPSRQAHGLSPRQVAIHPGVKSNEERAGKSLLPIGQRSVQVQMPSKEARADDERRQRTSWTKTNAMPVQALELARSCVHVLAKSQ